MKNYLAADVVMESRGILVNGPDQLRRAIDRLGLVIGSNIPAMRPVGGGSFAEKFEAQLRLALPAICAATHWQLRIPAVISDLSEEGAVSTETILIDIERLPDTDNEPYLVQLILAEQADVQPFFVQVRLPMNFASRPCEATVAADLGVDRGLEAARVVVTLAKRRQRVAAGQDARPADIFEVDLADVVGRLGVSNERKQEVGRFAAQVICNRGNAKFGEYVLNALPNYAEILTLHNVAPPISHARAEGKVSGPLLPVEAKLDEARINGWLRRIPGMKGEYEDPQLIISLQSACRSRDSDRFLPLTDRYDQNRVKEQALQIAAAFRN